AGCGDRACRRCCATPPSAPCAAGRRCAPGPDRSRPRRPGPARPACWRRPPASPPRLPPPRRIVIYHTYLPRPGPGRGTMQAATSGSAVAQVAAHLHTPATLAHLLAHSVARAPDRTALVFGGRETSYRELGLRVAALARELRQRVPRGGI